MSYSEPTSPRHPEGTPEFVSARARRRRAMRRAYFPADQEERAELFNELVRRAFPSYELFVFSLVSGAILGIGYLFNAQAILIFGILAAPLLTPWIGITLSAIAGALRLFLQTLTALLIGSGIIFLGAWIAGLAVSATGSYEVALIGVVLVQAGAITALVWQRNAPPQATADPQSS